MNMLKYIKSKKARNDLKDLLSSCDGDVQLKKLDKLPKVPKLFKYSSLNEFILEDLQNNTLTATSASEFNDLYDSSLHSNSYHKRKKRIDQLKESGKKLGYENLLEDLSHENLEKQCKKIDEHRMDYFKGDFFITCLTPFKDNIRMWSHYADSNKGICIEYDFANSKLSKFIYPVIYRKKPIDITKMYDESEKLNLALLGSIINKCEDWKYENEWRIIYYLPQYNNENKKRIKINPPKPKRIFLGREFMNNFKQAKRSKRKKQEVNLINLFLEYVKDEEIPLKIVKRKIGSYEFEFVDIQVEEILREV